MKYCFIFFALLSSVFCKAQYQDTLLIKICETNQVIGDVVNNHYSVFGLKRKFNAKIDTLDYQFTNPNLLKKGDKLYLVSLGNNITNSILIAIPLYIEQKDTALSCTIHAIVSSDKFTLCEFSFDNTGNVFNTKAMHGFGKNENCYHKTFQKMPSSFNNMFLNTKK